VASGSSGTPTPLPNEVLQITKTISQGAMEAKRQADAAGPLRQHNDRNKWTLQWYTSHYSHHAAEWATIATGNSRLRAAFAFLVASFARPTARLRLRWF
jgi:hypothetical protein